MNQFHYTVRAPQAPLPWRITAAMQLHEDADAPTPQIGDRLVFFYQVEGREPVKLGAGTCKSGKLAMIWRSGRKLKISEDGLPLLDREVDWLARDAGYSSAAAFLGHFEQRYGLPFYGVLVRW